MEKKFEWQEVLYWNHSDAWYFYSILKPNFSEVLKIPKTFVKHFDPNLPANVVLIGRNGKDWPVGLTRGADNNMVFQSGWQRFVEDHSLQEGDVLVFRYTGDFRFNVLMFDKTGCEKLGGFFMNNINFDGRSSMDFFHASFSHAGLATLAQSAEASENTSSNSSQLEELARCGKRKTWRGGSSVYHHRRGGRTSMAKSRQALARLQKALRSTGGTRGKPNEDPVGRKRKWSRTHPSTSEDPRKQETSVRIPPGGWKSYSLYFVSNRRLVTAEELERTLASSLAFKPSNPSFHVLMKRSHVTVRFALIIPVDFVRDYLPNGVTQILLRVPHGKIKWNVEYEPVKTRLGGQLRKGWSDFVFDNSLEEGDAGVFELVKTNGGTFLDVHIFRVVPEFVPLTKLKKGGKGRRRWGKRKAHKVGPEIKEVKEEAVSDSSS